MDGTCGKQKRKIFVLEGEKAEGWWQLMEAFHEVAGIDLVPPEWLKGKGRGAASQKISHDVPSIMVEVPRVQTAVGVPIRAETGDVCCDPLQTIDYHGTGRADEVVRSGRGGSNKFEFQKYREVWSREGDWAGFVYLSSWAERGRKKYIWVKKSKWIDHPRPSKKMGKKCVKSFW